MATTPNNTQGGGIKIKPVDRTKINPDRILNINIGVLGHVDSGKTSLVKTLSTLLSTASLDKSSQSRERGITLDLGFSAFLLPALPPSFAPLYGDDYDMLQVTLVDCPGHASLIRTIIGGAQIIDMVLLVIDATKGIQTQTAECIVIAEMTAPSLVVALNKVDLFKPEDKTQEIHKVSTKVANTLKYTRFKNAKMVPISAAVGGEKVAAVSISQSSNSHSNSNTSGSTSASTLPTENINSLLDLITTEIRPPQNRKLQSLLHQKKNFHFAVDHCFPIKGQGTVITGTVLSGFAQINDMIEFPQYAIQRKIKSMQMFRTPIKQIKQGDRAGICLANLDSKLLERGVVSHPGSVKLIEAAIAVVKKVRYYKGSLVTGAKFHVSVGHSTVMATATFWGARELKKHLTSSKAINNAHVNIDDNNSSNNNNNSSNNELSSSSLGGSADIAGLPRLGFDFNQDFLQQDEVLDSILDNDDDDDDNHASNSNKQSSNQELPLHWALLIFQTPVYCPLNSLIIGSRLDTDIQANSCRLAFSGRLVEKCDPKKDFARIKMYTRKEKVGQVCRLGEPYTRLSDSKVVRYDVYGHDLFKKETNMTQFVGLKIQTAYKGEVGVIQSSFGTSGKFKVHFPAGTQVKDGEKLFLRFKRYANDKDKAMHQDDALVLPKPEKGDKLVVENKKSKKNKKNDKTNSNNDHAVKNASVTQAQNTSGTTATVVAATPTTNTATATTTTSVATGEISSLKGDAMENGKYNVAIVAGLFTPEINIREKLGWKVIIMDTKQEGSILGPFGKAGKCKVAFPEGLMHDAVGKKVELKTLI